MTTIGIVRDRVMGLVCSIVHWSVKIGDEVVKRRYGVWENEATLKTYATE